MRERIAALFAAGALSEDGVRAAVARGWITQEQCDEIVGA